MRLTRKHFVGGTLVLAIFVVAGLFAHHALAQASRSSSNNIIPEVPIYQEVLIPGGTTEQSASGFLRGRVRDLADYLGLIYNFLISIVGTLAAVMMMIGGFQYLTAGGDKGKVDAGKKRILNALMGMVLALGSYLILNTINPNLVNLQVPTVAKVKTELAFLPFCDLMAKRLNIKISDLKVVSPHTSYKEATHGSSDPTNGGKEVVQGGDYNPNSPPQCGYGGFYEQAAADKNGKQVKSRLWCVFRGDPFWGKKLNGSQGSKGEWADYGCSDQNVEDDSPITDSSWAALSICMPQSGLSNTQLDKKFDADGNVGWLGQCESCPFFTSGTMQAMGYPVGDDACLAWQNVANNGDPQDNTFKFSHRQAVGIIQDTRVTHNTTGWIFKEEHTDDRAGRMYYCSYSAANKRCAYSPIHCDDYSSCGAYGDKLALHYCEQENSKGEFTCHSDSLGSKYRGFVEKGLPIHLAAICLNNPCDTTVTGPCKVPGYAAQIDAAAGKTVGVQGASTLIRGATLGILGQITCSN